MKNFTPEAVEMLQNLERLSLLKVIEQNKVLMNKVIDLATKRAGEVVTKKDVQNAISESLDN